MSKPNHTDREDTVRNRQMSMQIPQTFKGQGLGCGSVTGSGLLKACLQSSVTGHIQIERTIRECHQHLCANKYYRIEELVKVPSFQSSHQGKSRLARWLSWQRYLPGSPTGLSSSREPTWWRKQTDS